MRTTTVAVEGVPLPPVVNLPNGPIAAGTRPRYAAQLFDDFGVGIPANDLATFTLTLVDTLSNAVVNGVDDEDILNVGRGTVDAEGNFVVTLEVTDTGMDEVPGASRVQRSMVLDWTTTADPPLVGRHQANFYLYRLAGPSS